MTRSPVAFGLVAALFASACDEEPKKNPFEPPPKQTVEPPKDAEPPKPKGPPELGIDDMGPKVGFTRVLLDKPEGRDRLAKELGDTKEWWDGKEVTLTVIRNAKWAWVRTMMQEIGKVGASKVIVKTETRKEFPGELAFTPLTKAPSPEPCALVGTILDDRSTAIWKVSGGMAMKRAKGLAGPDLSTTADTISRLAKACSKSSTFYVAGDDAVEWGLTYDLAASTKKLDDVKLDIVVLLENTPIAGRKVEFGK